MSVGSEWQATPLMGAAQEDSSNDGGLVIVDDAHTVFPPGTLPQLVACQTRELPSVLYLSIVHS